MIYTWNGSVLGKLTANHFAQVEIKIKAWIIAGYKRSCHSIKVIGLITSFNWKKGSTERKTNKQKGCFHTVGN